MTLKTLTPAWVRNGDTAGMALYDFGTFKSYLTPSMARTWRAFTLSAFANTGQTLVPVSAGDVFRFLQDQVKLFDQRYERVSLAVYLVTAPSRRKKYGGGYFRLRKGMAMAATPGTSNHGNGGAIDVGWLVDGKVVGITENAWAYAWLMANAPLFLLHFPVRSEAWHMEKGEGDDIAQRVVDVENFLGLPQIVAA